MEEVVGDTSPVEGKVFYVIDDGDRVVVQHKL